MACPHYYYYYYYYFYYYYYYYYYVLHTTYYVLRTYYVLDGANVQAEVRCCLRCQGRRQHGGAGPHHEGSQRG